MNDELEIVRGQYFDRTHVPYLTLYNDILSFNDSCIELMGDCEYVNIIIEKDGKIIRVRGCEISDYDSVRWYKVKRGIKVPRKMRSRMFTAMLFDRLGFDYEHKYRLRGEYSDTDVPELIFYTSDPQVFVLREWDGRQRFVERYPEDWKDSFGIPISKRKRRRIATFEEYTVLDVKLDKVDQLIEDTVDAEDVEKMNELKEKYIKG